MNTKLILILPFLLSACTSATKVSTATNPTRTIASDSKDVIVITGFHEDHERELSLEDLRLTGQIIESDFKLTSINFRILNETPDANGRRNFSFEINRANAHQIVESMSARLRNYNPGVVRTSRQVREQQQTADCMIHNLTVSNFLAEFSASDSFNFRFVVPESIRAINLATGVVDSAKPRCEIWGPQNNIDALLYVNQ